jgi:hypothetical protein
MRDDWMSRAVVTDGKQGGYSVYIMLYLDGLWVSMTMEYMIYVSK